MSHVNAVVNMMYIYYTLIIGYFNDQALYNNNFEDLKTKETI